MNDDSARITVSSPIVSMSVQTGIVREWMSTRRPILAPSALRYSEYTGEPVNDTSGLPAIMRCTTQKRR